MRGASTPVSLSCGSITVCSDDPHSLCSLGSMGHSAHRLHSDFNDYDNMDQSPYSGRRPSSHTAYVAESVSPSHARHQYEPHLPSFHHDHLHHAGQDVIGVSTLQPNSQRRERAREALLRRNCDLNLSVDSGHSNADSGSSRTTENPTETTVVHKHHLTNSRQTLNKIHVSTHSLHSVHSHHSHHSHHSNLKCDEDELNSDDHLSSEDNLSHESYDLLDKEQASAAQHSYSDKTYDNSYAGYSLQQTQMPSGNNENIEACHSYREDLINSNINCHSKQNSHSSTYSSRQSMNSSGLSASPLPEGLLPCEPQSILSRRRSSGSGTISQRSKSSRETSKSDPKSEQQQRAVESRISLREGHFLSEDNTDEFQGHEIHMSRAPSSQLSSGQSQQTDCGMHEGLIFQSPTNIQYFQPQIHQQPQQAHSRTLPNRKRREKSPVIFTTGKLSVDCSSASSSSQASPRISRPKSLDFSVVALQDLPQAHAYSYQDDTIEQHDFEENSSSTVSVQNNYASSSDVPQTPEVGAVPASTSSHPLRGLNSQKPIPTFHSSASSNKLANSPLYPGQHNPASERIYDIPEGVEMEDGVQDNSPASASTQTRTTVFSNVKIDAKSYKSYLEITRKFSSEESESISHKPTKLKILPPKGLKKVSSTESESAISNHSHHSVPQVQFDSDTLSLPIDLISPPLESESSTALVDSESLPAPPQFGSVNKDDTDIEDEVTPKGEEANGVVRQGNVDNKVVLLPPATHQQPEKSKFGFRVAPPVIQNIELVPPPRQESTYETRAEKMLESQLTRVDTFNNQHHHEAPQNNVLDIVDLDQEPDVVRDTLLLKALDSFESFNNDSLQISSRQESLTYEENAECALEKQTTVDSFGSQISADNNDVFFEQSIESKVQELHNQNFTDDRRDQILESQSTFESFTTECEVVVTKRQESTYEERAETVLESQNTIESFTTETVQTEDVFDADPVLSESSLLNDDCETQIEKADLVADMYVSKSDVPFMDENFDQELVSSGGMLACGQGDRITFNNFIQLIPAEQSTQTDDDKDTTAAETPEYPTGPYDTGPPPPLPPDDFGNYTVPHEPLYYRDIRGAFPMRTLSRISEKSSNDSGSTPSDGNDRYDEHEHNYSETDNENAPSISSDLPENMAAGPDDAAGNPLNDLHVEYDEDDEEEETNPSSHEESPKNTECTQLDQDTLEDDDEDEDLDETNAEEIKTEERDLPPDFKPELTVSITSEADITNKDSDGSLHDSMEILEEVTTDPCFERDLNRASFERKESEESQRQIQWKVTMPPKNSSKSNSQGGSAAGGSKPGLLKKPSVSLSESSGKYVVTEGTEEIIL